MRDATGNGSRSGTEDLSDLYAESTPTILGFDDDAVYAQTAKGGAIARWDLEDRAPQRPGGQRIPGHREPTGGPLVDFNLVHGVPRETPAATGGGYAGRRSPDGRRVAYTLVGRPVVYTTGDRKPVQLAVGGGTSCWQAGLTQTGSTASPSTRPSAPQRR